LAGSCEEVATRDRHLSFFAGLGEQAERGLRTSATASWLSVLGAEHDNLRPLLTGAWRPGSRAPAPGSSVPSASSSTFAAFGPRAGAGARTS
jgi:hypothetical protein